MNGYWIIFIISIHAPPRGATGTENFSQVQQENFNSRPSARGDLYRRMHKARGVYFNSRPSARGDCVRAGRTAHCGDFNSRPSARGDLIPRLLPHDFRQFQFTPLREGRPVLFGTIIGLGVFQFTPLREGRRKVAVHATIFFKVFQFTPLREGRPNEMRKLQTNLISIHAPPRGATLTISLLSCACTFQFTPLREGRPAQPASPMFCSTNFNSRPSARGDPS